MGEAKSTSLGLSIFDLSDRVLGDPQKLSFPPKGSQFPVPNEVANVLLGALPALGDLTGRKYPALGSKLTKEAIALGSDVALILRRGAFIIGRRFWFFGLVLSRLGGNICLQ